MPVPPFAAIQRGTAVSIVLKADQRTGRQVQGTVAETLTRGNHPRGVKVRLTDGRVGRVQAVMSGNQSNSSTGYSGQSQQDNQYAQPSQSSYGSAQHNQYGSAQHNQYGSVQHHQYGSAQQNQYGSAQQNQYGEQQYRNPGQSMDYAGAVVPEYAPARPPRPSQGQPHTLGSSSTVRDARRHTDNRENDDIVPASERGEQIETFEQYENTRAQTQEERDRALLQSEFKTVDGSLIAAIYGDAQGDVSYCREMLQALSE